MYGIIIVWNVYVYYTCLILFIFSNLFYNNLLYPTDNLKLVVAYNFIV